MTPRLLRLRDAPNYLGMARSIFERDVRPYLTHIRIGTQGVAFDRLELDAYASYARDGGTPPEETAEWQNVAQGSPNEEMFGTSTNEYEVELSGKVRERPTSEKPKPFSPYDSKNYAEAQSTECADKFASERRLSDIFKNQRTSGR